MNEQYVLHSDGRWFYYVPRIAPGEAFADGVPMVACGGQSRYGWWASDHEASVVTVRMRRPARKLGYKLRDPAAASERFPPTLTLEQFESATGDDEDSVLYQLYESVTKEQDPKVEEVPGPWLRLDGEPPPHDGRVWTASLPSELWNRQEYLHLFPGYMPGFRDHMKEVIKALPRVRYALDATGRPGVLEVTVEVPFDKPVSEFRPARNADWSRSRSRKGHTVQVTATRKLSFSLPYRIDAPDRAAAAAQWDRRKADVLDAIEAASVAACSHCGGHGYVPVGGTETGAQ